MKNEEIWKNVLAEIENPFDDESDWPYSARYSGISGNFEWLQSLGFHFGQVSFNACTTEYIRFKLIKLIATAVCWINELDAAEAEKNKVKPILAPQFEPPVDNMPAPDAVPTDVDYQDRETWQEDLLALKNRPFVETVVDYTMTVEEVFHFMDSTVFAGSVDNNLHSLTPAKGTLIASDGSILGIVYLNHERMGSNNKRVVTSLTDMAHCSDKQLSGAVLMCRLLAQEPPPAIVDQLT